MISGHNSITMTETYDHTKQEKQEVIKGILSGEILISSSNKTALQRIEGEENPFKGKTVDQIDKMRKSLKIELLPHGVCLHHPMRGEPCAQDGVCLCCKNFIASSNHLPIYEKRLERVDKELEKSDDSSIFSNKLRYQRKKLEKYISDLQKKMAQSEFKEEALEKVAGAKHEE